MNNTPGPERKHRTSDEPRVMDRNRVQARSANKSLCKNASTIAAEETNTAGKSCSRKQPLPAALGSAIQANGDLRVGLSTGKYETNEPTAQSKVIHSHLQRGKGDNTLKVEEHFRLRAESIAVTDMRNMQVRRIHFTKQEQFYSTQWPN